MTGVRRAVIVDLDDTLYLELDYVGSGYRAVADWAYARWGLPAQGTVDQLWRFFALDRRTVLGDWLDTLGHGSALAEAIGVYREHTPEIELSAHWRRLLRRWRREFALGVVTDGRASVQAAKVEALRLADVVDVIVYSDNLGGPAAWKPNPLPYCTACLRLRVQEGLAIYVGDNPSKDFLGARRAGLASVRLRLPGGLHATAEPREIGHQPDYEALSLDELDSVIEAWRQLPTD